MDWRRVPFDHLTPNEQKLKLNKIYRIYLNWGDDLNNCIPSEHLPRKWAGYSSKAKISDGDAPLEWDPREWSLGLLHVLETLSALTKSDLDTAQELLLEAVERRQTAIGRGYATSHKYVAELLVSDVQEAIRRVRGEEDSPDDDTTYDKDSARAGTVKKVTKASPPANAPQSLVKKEAMEPCRIPARVKKESMDSDDEGCSKCSPS